MTKLDDLVCRRNQGQTPGKFPIFISLDGPKLYDDVYLQWNLRWGELSFCSLGIPRHSLESDHKCEPSTVVCS